MDFLNWKQNELKIKSCENDDDDDDEWRENEERKGLLKISRLNDLFLRRIDRRMDGRKDGWMCNSMLGDDQSFHPREKIISTQNNSNTDKYFLVFYLTFLFKNKK